MTFRIHASGVGSPAFLYTRTSLSEGDLFGASEFAAARASNIVGARPRGSLTNGVTRVATGAYGRLAAAALLEDSLTGLMTNVRPGSWLVLAARHSHYVTLDEARYLRMGLGRTGEAHQKVNKIAMALTDVDMNYWGIVLEIAQAVAAYRDVTSGPMVQKMIHIQVTM